MFGNLLKRNFHLVDLIVACLIDARRLAGWTHKNAAEKIRESGDEVVPVADEKLRSNPGLRRIENRLESLRQ